MTHNDVWCAIDNMAASLHITPSALARCGGMDPTAFNKSKRYTVFGKPRWPSMQSLSKILTATHKTIDDFVLFFPHHYDNQRN